jgi:hypothetical protein
LAPFSFFCSLGAGSGKRRKRLGAHQERISIAMKENTAVFAIYNQITFAVLEI